MRASLHAGQYHELAVIADDEGNANSIAFEVVERVVVAEVARATFFVGRLVVVEGTIPDDAGLPSSLDFVNKFLVTYCLLWLRDFFRVAFLFTLNLGVGINFWNGDLIGEAATEIAPRSLDLSSERGMPSDSESELL